MTVPAFLAIPIRAVFLAGGILAAACILAYGTARAAYGVIAG